MITADQIRHLRLVDIDADDTVQLLAQFAQIRSIRRPLFLTAAEFEQILEWKLGSQIGRGRTLRARNTDELIRSITGLALTLTHADKDYELELRINILCALRGVAVAVASAVLALVFPEEYAVIDYRGWRQIFGGEGSGFTTSDYKRYMVKVRQLADELSWPVQEVDHAIWEYDRTNSKSR